MGGSPSPKPAPDGVIVLYENVKLSVTNGIIDVEVDTGKSVATTRIDQKTGMVTGAWNTPDTKAPDKKT
jgi:hypothetical protein